MATKFNHFAQIAEALPKACSQVVRKTALDAQGNIQAHIVANGQVDTSFMLNSVYAVTSEGSGYHGGARALPEVAHPPDDQSASVAVAAEYAIYQNNGTHLIPARPFFEPGIEDTRPGFESAVAAIQAKLAEAAR